MIVFRCDASSEIGAGHVMRCIALAELFSEHCEQVCFICQQLPTNLESVIRGRGFQVQRIPGAAELVEQVSVCREIANELRAKLLVVDHYDLDAEFECHFSSDIPVLVIDDLYNRRHECQFLIDNNFRKSYDNLYLGKVPNNTSLFLGPRHSFLRREFWPYRSSVERENPKSAKSVLAFFGGSDFEGMTLRFLDAIQQSNSGIDFNIVVGGANPHMKEIRKVALSDCVQLHIDPLGFEGLLRDVGLFFGSGGVITWERMFLGLPGVVVAVADNQEEVAQDLADTGHQFYWGKAKNLDFKIAIERLAEVAERTEELRQMSVMGRRLVDIFDVTEVLRAI